VHARENSIDKYRQQQIADKDRRDEVASCEHKCAKIPANKNVTTRDQTRLVYRDAHHPDQDDEGSAGSHWQA